jgi:hypothetical protein
MYQNYEYRKVQGLIGETSFSIILPKTYALGLEIVKDDLVKVRQEEGIIHRERKNVFQFFLQ